MASQQTFSTHDLRAGSVDYNRDHEQKAKWANGPAWGPGRPLGSNPRPFRINHRVAAAHRREKAKEVAHAARNRKQEILPIDQYTSGESTDEEPAEPSAAPEPDAEITYSFDADKGPSQGSQILGQALLQAIERFEDRKTHELVSEEYEVLDENGEPASPRRRAGGKGKKALKSEDEDWEHV
ncbi:hypothetical protein UCRNP2_7147 [Neofusicoccum parvum UCRNP2]|uniref:Uncharacterized protein n=1 Tax=Botryosphaeria parva (strain UCR-NP2) TaxID=1287680 RepID=R1G3Y0_BOTPV|nr:hypothetical protein UCRNP2_7147 [Neofusicoccum parvum UCRNP2]